MAKSYTIKQDNVLVESKDNYFTSGERINKTLTKMSGEGKWNSLHGVKFLVDTDGCIINGPEEFTGRKWNDIKDLDYLDLFGVMRNVSRAATVMNKSMVFDPYGNFGAQKFANPSELADKYREMARAGVDKAVAKKKELMKPKDPLYRS